MESLEILTKSPEETQQVGRGLGELLEGGEVLLMTGGLGAGKTCLTQGVAWGLGVKEHARSPTFVLVSQYQGRVPLYHIDLYRIDDIMEIENLGLEEYFGSGGACVIEWAEKAAPLWPEENLTIEIKVTGPEDRTIILKAWGPRYRSLLDTLSASYPSPGKVLAGG